MELCHFDACGRPLLSKGLCQTHYQQHRRGEQLRPIKLQNGPPPRECEGPGCDRHGSYGGLCWAHKRQQKKGQTLVPLWSTKNRAPVPCAFDGCKATARSRGLCQSHARQRDRAGVLRPIHTPSYRYVTADGYIRLYDPGHPNADRQGRVLEHTKVMADVLGRPLWPDENVHHLNGVRDDNRPENLELWCRRQPKGQRVPDKVAWAVEVLRRYQPDMLRDDPGMTNE